jgi:hypothetical protein
MNFLLHQSINPLPAISRMSGDLQNSAASALTGGSSDEKIPDIPPVRTLAALLEYNLRSFFQFQRKL